MRRRGGRPGLVGTMARTAVIAGTATAVSGSVQRSAAERAAPQQGAPGQTAPPPAPGQTAPPPAPALAAQPGSEPAPPVTDESFARIRELGQLKAEGLLSEEEFTAAKASILGI